MNELKELVDRLEQQWDTDNVHFEVLCAEKYPDGRWNLVVRKREEVKDEEGSKTE